MKNDEETKEEEFNTQKTALSSITALRKDKRAKDQSYKQFFIFP